MLKSGEWEQEVADGGHVLVLLSSDGMWPMAT